MGWLYLIEILHQTTTRVTINTFFSSCILSKFYIKPQPENVLNVAKKSCILSKFYIKPQHYPMLFVDMSRCILSKFYIKPQRRRWLSCCFSVVSYRNSTSNHNAGDGYPVASLLYLIEILHQTTTLSVVFGFLLCCILSKFYIKPQHYDSEKCINYSCILSKFYIKPQLCR